MTDTNDKETFESYLERLHCSQTSFNELARAYYEHKKTSINKQKVREAIEKKDYQIEELKETIQVLEQDMNLDYEDRIKKQLKEKDIEIEALTLLCEGKELSKKEKDAEIKELQVENEKLKYSIINLKEKHFCENCTKHYGSSCPIFKDKKWIGNAPCTISYCKLFR